MIGLSVFRGYLPVLYPTGGRYLPTLNICSANVFTTFKMVGPTSSKSGGKGERTSVRLYTSLGRYLPTQKVTTFSIHSINV